jgi:hypothetical protein
VSLLSDEVKGYIDQWRRKGRRKVKRERLGRYEEDEREGREKS